MPRQLRVAYPGAIYQKQKVESWPASCEKKRPWPWLGLPSD